MTTAMGQEISAVVLMIYDGISFLAYLQRGIYRHFTTENGGKYGVLSSFEGGVTPLFVLYDNDMWSIRPRLNCHVIPLFCSMRIRKLRLFILITLREL